jgi:hypothetical protein
VEIQHDILPGPRFLENEALSKTDKENKAKKLKKEGYCQEDRN